MKTKFEHIIIGMTADEEAEDKRFIKEKIKQLKAMNQTDRTRAELNYFRDCLNSYKPI